MARICSIRGTRVRSGGKIHRSGLAKKKGGIGRHVTKVVKRTISPNLQTKRIWVPELSKFVRIKLSCRALKTINKNGAFDKDDKVHYQYVDLLSKDLKVVEYNPI